MFLFDLSHIFTELWLVSPISPTLTEYYLVHRYVIWDIAIFNRLNDLFNRYNVKV